MSTNARNLESCKIVERVGHMDDRRDFYRTRPGAAEGGGFRAPMARAVIGGLITSTPLTLVVVPVAYTYFDDFDGWRADSKRGPKEAMSATGEPVRGGGPTPHPTYGD